MSDTALFAVCVVVAVVSGACFAAMWVQGGRLVERALAHLDDAPVPYLPADDLMAVADAVQGPFARDRAEEIAKCDIALWEMEFDPADGVA